MASTNEAVFQDLIQAIQGMPRLPVRDYGRRLHNKARSNPMAEELYTYITEEPRFPQDDPDANNQYMDGVHIRDLLGIFANANQVGALGNVESSRDKYDFASSVNSANGDKNFLKVITSLTSYCYGEHINRTLRDRGLPDLRALAGRFGFPDYMKSELLTPRFIRAQIWSDVNRGDYVFSLLMLYILDYMRYGPQGMPAYNTDYWNRPSYDVVGAWSWILWEYEAASSNSKVDNLVTFCGQASTLVILPVQGSESPRPQQLFTCIKNLYSLIARDDWLTKNIRKPANMRTEYVQAVNSSIDRLEYHQNAVNQWESDIMAMKNTWQGVLFSRWQTAMDQGLANEYTYQANNDTVIVTGQPVFSWLESGYARERNFNDRNWWQMFISQPPYNREYINNGSCFRVGTQIALADGAIAIENIKEWDQVLTLAEPEQYGTVSNETVRHDIPVALVGFNGETPFATPAHVFHTTTGLRAVESRAAMRENPWAKVGHLAAGHVLYRLREGDCRTYDTVEIRSIHRTGVASRTVHGIHLRQGLRSYHADGYLVALNYPEITVKSMSDLLRAFPPAKRVSLLQHLKELKPLFKEFGAQAISDRFSMELYGSRKLPTTTRLGQGMPYNAPSDTGSTIQPKSRTLSGFEFERLIRSFQLIAQSHSRTSETHLLPQITLIDGDLMVDGSAQIKTAVDSEQRTVRWSRKLGLQGEYEHGTLQIDPSGLWGSGSVLFCAEVDPSTFSKENVVPVLAIPSEAAPDPFVRSDPMRRSFQKQGQGVPFTTDEDGGTIVFVDSYSMTYDRSVWPPDTERPNAVNPISGGTIGYGLYRSQEGAQLPIVTIPVLDKLRDHLNDQLYNGETKLEPFYRFSNETTPEGKFRYTIEMNQSSLIPFISGSGLDNIDPFNVSFRDTLGIDLVIPFLYQSFYFEFDPWFENFTGAMYKYDPTMRGMKGDRHFISGSYEGIMQRESLRAEISRAMAAFAKPGLPNQHNPQMQPSSITKSLLATRPPDINRLVNLPNYDEQTVHSTSQILIQNMMYWHMDPEQLRQFTTASRPTDLPPQLTTQLPHRLRDFFRDKYGPAFIARSIAQFPDYRDRLTERERRKITYWWEGNGETCLSRSQEYTEINNLASMAAMRQLYANTLDDYFNSREGPAHWAQELYNSQVRRPNMNGLLSNPISGQNNLINMRCNIMNVLAPDATHAEDFFRAIIAHAAQMNINYPYADDNPDLAYQWLTDALRDLIIKVLNDDPSITREIKEGLLADLQEFERLNGLNQALVAELRAANIVQRQAVLTRELSHWLTAIGKPLARAFGGTKLFSWSATVFDEASRRVPSLPGKEKLKGLSAIGMTSLYVMEVIGSVMGIVQHWEILAGPQRAVLILETLRMATSAAGSAIDAWNRYRGGSATGPQAFTDSVMLDQSAMRTLRNSPQALGDMAQQVTGERHALENNVSNHLREAGPPQQGGRRESWNESNRDTPNGLQPGGRKSATKFSMNGQWLNSLNAVLGVGVTVAMAFNLVRDWNQLTNVGKVIETLSVIVQGLSVLLDIVVIGMKVGLIATSATFGAALPIIGAVLAVLGLVLTIIGIFVNIYREPDPPPDPVQTFINNVARRLMDTWLDAPDPKLAYSISPSRVNGGRTASVTVNLRNNTNSDVRLTRVEISLNGGPDPVCLFREDDFSLPDQSSRTKMKELSSDPLSTGGGTVRVTPTDKTMARLDITRFTDYMQCAVNLFGNQDNPDTPLGDLLLKPRENFTVVWTGLVNSPGESTIEVFEVTNQDNTRESLPITRT